jgi:lipid-A-disaccharide synthase
VDRVVALFEREADVYRRMGLSMIYEGHPIADLRLVQPRRGEARAALGLPDDRPVLGLFPGSRQHEVARLLPILLDAAGLLSREIPNLIPVIAAASAPCHRQVMDELAERGLSFHVSNHARDLLVAGDVNLAASGTILLEAAMLDAPAAMVYLLDPVSAFYARRILRLPKKLKYYAMPNIAADDLIVPELVANHATAPALAEVAARHLSDERAVERMRAGYARVREHLGTPGVAARVAERLLEPVKAVSNASRKPVRPREASAADPCPVVGSTR